MPIYVAEDSADTWAEPELFQLDKKDFTPLRVAGVPPDYFCADGQRWGNPLYDWKKMRRDKFRWWLRRLHSAGALFDWLRIDHFIGFANYYSIPASCPTAREGKWVKSPGKALFKRVEKALPELKIIAEDLGEVGPRVRKLIDHFDAGVPVQLLQVQVQNSALGRASLQGSHVRVASGLPAGAPRCV